MSEQSDRAPARLFWEEPFRVFFPLAVLATLGGVLLWPLYHYGVVAVYPGIPHARIMTAGLAGILIGFMGTAAPRLVDARPLRRWEVALVLLLWLGSLAMHFAGFHAVLAGKVTVIGTQAGDALLAVTIMVTLAMLVGRWFGKEGKDTPPPGFPVAMAGLLAGAAGAAALAWQNGAWMGPKGLALAKLFLYQALPLLPLVGVAPFLLPRFYGHSSTHRFDDSPTPPRGWWPRFWICSGAGVLLLASFAIEAWGWPRSGMGLRVAACLGVLLLETPVFRRAVTATTPGTAVRWAFVSLLVGLAWALVEPVRRMGLLEGILGMLDPNPARPGPIFDPLRQMGIMHLFYVSGIGLVMLATGTRVVLGHAGRHDLLGGRIRWLRVVMGLAILASTTRVSADFLPKVHDTHLDYAAYTWVAGAGLWLWMLRRYFATTERDEDEERARQCRKARGRKKGRT